MSRKKTLSSKRKIALAVSAAVVAGGGAFAFAANSNAAQSSTVCDGLNTALSNNQKFIEGQRANPDAQSAARIANREAVIAQIQVQQKASGCEVTGGAQGASGGGGGQATEPAAPSAPAEQTGGAGDGGGAVNGQQVCTGSTVTLSGEGGAPAASSNQFPAGTKLKVTNLDNGKSTTVEVTSVSGSCALLNNAAFELVREPGKFLIRRAVIEKVG
ncbi:hypothetical protein ACFVT5_35665 [Streptomyces sp. NPDC058001]|uniref:hypothetical protein n=1 Tax=Streptomyces sp. NPDC058001 TaxID=3346300 RepID=UPI0036F129EA